MKSPANRPPHAPRQILQKWYWAVLVFIMLLGGYFLSVMVYSPDAIARPSRDFIAFYAASDMARHGLAAAAYDPDQLIQVERRIWYTPSAVPWLYPPTALVITYPLAAMTYVSALTVFMLFSLIVLILAARQFSRLNEDRLAILAFPAILLSIMFGQNGMLTAAFALLALHNLPARPWLAGLWAGLLSIKPHLAVLLPFAMLLGGHHRTLLSMLLTITALFITSITLFGTESWLGFITSLGNSRNWLDSGQLALPHMISVFANLHLIGLSTTVAYIIHSSVSLVFLTIFLLTWKTCQDIRLRGAALALATLMLSPYMFNYDLTWLGIAILLLKRYADQHGWYSYEPAILIFCWSFPLLAIAATLLLPKNNLLASLTIIPTTLMLTMIIRRLIQPDTPPTNP